MKTSFLRRVSIAALLSLSVAHAQSTATKTAPAKPDASAAIEKKDNDGRFRKMHESFLARGKEGPIGVLFIGDSITQGWTKAPDVWKQHYEKYQPANFGIGGDQTQHVIWRIENGELDGISPKVAVVMIGTNNTGANDANEIAAANKKIVQMIRAKLPQTKVLLLGVFPRGPRKDKAGNVNDDGVAKMAIIRDVNRQLAKLDDGKNVRFLDIGAKFLDESGKIPDAIMPDQLHPTAAGYKIWAEAMQPTLDAMMK
jgi:lysophospholipase L1-like esterase